MEASGRKTCFVLLNASSGTVQSIGLTPELLCERFAAHGVDAEVVSIGRDGSFDTLLERARQTVAPILVAAGGDGTVTALAEAALDSDKQLAILPLGTANLLARDLSIPLDIETWLQCFASMEPRGIDVCSVNGRLFLHKVVLGLAPGIATAREHLRKRGGLLSTLAFLGFIKRRIERLRRIRVTIDIDAAGPERHVISTIAVANNAYDEGFGRVFSRGRLDRGKFTVYIAERITVPDAMRMLGGMIIGSWHADSVFTAVEASDVTLDRHKKRVIAMIDGDPVRLENPLRFTMRPGALTVLAPPPLGNTPGPEPIKSRDTG